MATFMGFLRFSFIGFMGFLWISMDLWFINPPTIPIFKSFQAPAEALPPRHGRQVDARAEPGEQLDGVAALRKRESLGLPVIRWMGETSEDDLRKMGGSGENLG